MLSPVTRYRAPRRNALRLLGKILLWVFALLFVAAGALAGGAWLFINQSVSAVRAHTPEVREAQKILDVPVPGEPAVAIVIGYDKRAGADKALESRSDTVMLIRADPGQKTISVLSFPRDLVVDIPACKDHLAFRSRINEAYTYCGQKGTLQTVKQLTGIPINYMIAVNFRGFRQIVDKLGGVYLDVDRRYFNDNAGRGPGQTFATINLHPGYQRVTGSRALDYVRYRHTDSDLYRLVRQQEFVKALKQQVSSFWSISKLPGIVKTITDNVEVGVGGGKLLDVETIFGYAKLAYELPAGNFYQVRIEGLEGYAELFAAESEIEAAVQRFMNPDVTAAEKAASVATGRKPKDTAPPPASVTLEVLNGNGVAGAADEAGYLLSQRGYQVTNGGNADRFDYFRTKVLYDPVSTEARAAAEGLAKLFGDAEVEPAPAGAALPAMLRVIVGQTFHGTIGPGPSDSTPKHEPPAVVKDSSSVLPLVRAAQRKVDFPLYVPTVRELGSVLDAEEPVRVYKLNGEDAVRIVYRTGTSEYWGIQQTGWAEAPILSGPSVTRTLRGRDYRLYFNGSRLHMVAFEAGGVAYWVVNTLLEKLSNETMLAIAKGLRPLAR